MNKTRVLLFAVCLAVGCCARAYAADTGRIHSLVFLRAGGGISGEIIGVDKDSLTIVDSLPQRIAREDISHIVARRIRPQGRGFVSGTVVGIVGLSMLLTMTEGQPAPFVASSIYDDIGEPYSGGTLIAGFIALASIGVTGSIGMFVDGSRDYDEKTIVWGTAEEEQNAAWQQLRAWDAKEPGSKLRLSMVSATVWGAMRNQFIADAHNAGLSTEYAYRYAEYLQDDDETFEAQPDPAGNFNMLRRLQATYAVAPRVEVGASYALLGEPSVYAQQNSYANGISSTRGAREILNTRGYYAVGLYDFASIGSDFSARVGGGVGLADVHYRLDAFSRRDSSSVNIEQHIRHENISTTAFSTILLAELSYRLYDHLSIGLTADYALVPISRTIPAVEFVGLPARTLAPNSGSVGLTINVHL